MFSHFEKTSLRDPHNIPVLLLKRWKIFARPRYRCGPPRQMRTLGPASADLWTRCMHGNRESGTPVRGYQKNSVSVNLWQNLFFASRIGLAGRTCEASYRHGNAKVLISCMRLSNSNPVPRRDEPWTSLHPMRRKDSPRTRFRTIGQFSTDPNESRGGGCIGYARRTISVLLILIFLSSREDFFRDWLLDIRLVIPGTWEPGATSGSPASYDGTCETQGRCVTPVPAIAIWLRF